MAERKNILYKPAHGYDRLTASEEAEMNAYCADYRHFLDISKTERECVDSAIALAEAKGYVEFCPGMELKPGTKVYFSNRSKAIMLAVVGEKPLSEGANIAAAHVDNPRLDLKQYPLYENEEMAFFKTHYYGGIKKYQWVVTPLALVGVVIRADGTSVDVSIGLNKGEPRFVITDLLPHLAGDQMKKNAGDFIPAESLNILLGTRPDKEEGSDRVKLAVMKLLNEKYGITEADFLSAELCAVPADEITDIGLDRSLIGGFGHDDRVCAYSELLALLDTPNPEKTAVCLLVDKEEIGSEGTTGMLAQAFDRFMDDLCRSQGVNLYECYAHSFCFSADVCNAFDPNFPEVSDKRNNCKLNYGVGIMKFTGSRGKSGSNDAPAEVVGRVRRLLDGAGVAWQMGELGKVDQGGGGTVAKYTAQRDIDTIDAGVPVLSMHAPFEVISKADLYSTYAAVKALYGEKE